MRAFMQVNEARVIAMIPPAVRQLAGTESIRPEHIAEAIQYRTLDRNLWR